MGKKAAAARKTRNTPKAKKAATTPRVPKVAKAGTPAKKEKARKASVSPRAGATKTRTTPVRAKSQKAPAAKKQRKAAKPAPHRSWPEIGASALKTKFSTERKARRWLEKVFWPNGPRCPGCGAARGHVRPLKGGGRRTHRCRPCGQRFGIGTAAGLKATKMNFRTWAIAIHMIATQPNISSVQMHRALGITQTTAWKMRCRMLAAHQLSRKGVPRTANPRRTYTGGRDEIDRKAEDWEMAAVELALRLPQTLE